ncbi:hypothetical protein F511_19027 [Dorcoceras hygrometricum]|uniref:Uncharacterized protein n=1 Tax=Dorcoceras hygrometricum TaxID=472368 RepID=A0A2Z7BKP7_9LAMI|nr:hypothetical protein F511_19027 [Dorcoceras hygrometricum]
MGLPSYTRDVTIRSPRCLLVQADEGTLLPIVDLIDDLQPPTDKSQFPCDSGWSQAPRRQQVDWAVKMRIRPPELETSICDAKYHVSLPPSSKNRRPPPLNPHARPPPTAAPPPPVCRVIGLVSITAMRRFRPWQNPLDLLVQIDGGRLIPVMDLIDDLPPPTV